MAYQAGTTKTIDSRNFANLEGPLREVWEDAAGARRDLRESMMEGFLNHMSEGFGSDADYSGRPIWLNARKYPSDIAAIMLAWQARNAELSGRPRQPSSQAAHFLGGYAEFRSVLGLSPGAVDFTTTGGLRDSLGSRSVLGKRSMTISIVLNYANHPHDGRPFAKIMAGLKAKYGDDMFTMPSSGPDSPAALFAAAMKTHLRG